MCSRLLIHGCYDVECRRQSVDLNVVNVANLIVLVQIILLLSFHRRESFFTSVGPIQEHPAFPECTHSWLPSHNLHPVY